MGQSAEVNDLRTEHLCIRGFDSGNINITLSAGSRIGILGAAGSGKTGLLRTLAWMDPPGSGSLYWGKTEVSRKSLWRIKKQQPYVSLLLANPYTFYEPKMRTGALLQDIAKASGENATELLQEIRIPDAALSRPVETLSGAMRIRLALTRIQKNRSPVVLIDDIFRYMIPEVWDGILSAIGSAVDGSQALLVASRFYDCLRITDDILVMDKGTVIEGGPREMILSNPAHPATRQLIQHRGHDHNRMGQTNPTMFCPTVSCPTVSCPTVSCPTVSCPTVSCPTVSRQENSMRDAVTSRGEAISVGPGHWVCPW